MERLFQISAVILAGIAAYFLWQKNGDGAFISAVVGAVCFFISFRFQVKERLKEREAAREAEENERGRNAETQLNGEGEKFDFQNVLNDVSANEQTDHQPIINQEKRTTL